jgi:hypothetical protein
MSKELPTNKNFYTFEELKDFTNNFTDLNIINISKFIEVKTDKEYTVVKRKMVCDLNKQLFENNIAAFDIQKFLNEQWAKTKEYELTKEISKNINNLIIETWAKVTEKNHLIIGRWKDELKQFE